jgi:hypothetical protein
MVEGGFLLDSVSDRFEVLHRRYHLFAKDLPCRFNQWLKLAPAQKRVFATLESVCSELFPDQLSIVSADFPQRWMLPVACVALKHHVVGMRHIELSACGKALRVLDEDQLPRRPYHAKEPDLLRASLADALSAATRTAELEVRVAELECKLKCPVYGGPIRTPEDDQHPRKKRAGMPLTDTERTLVYLTECRAEALDALLALRRTHRKGRRQSQRLEEAHAEISRLKEENESLRQRRCPDLSPPQAYLLPKRVLSLAGYWNLQPNELLSVTPTLTTAVEQRGGSVIRREGMHTCFLAYDQAMLIDVAVETMARCLPHCKRRLTD